MILIVAKPLEVAFQGAAIGIAHSATRFSRYTQRLQILIAG